MGETVGRSLLKGGCQCGAIRFAVEGELGTPSICHCRMCQKAFGNYFAPLVNMDEARLTWLKAEPRRFQSSNWVKRGFCPECGTPLTYESPNGIALAIGAFDHPDRIEPVRQYGMESRIAYLDHIEEWPSERSEDDLLPFMKTMVSHQYPDEP